MLTVKAKLKDAEKIRSKIVKLDLFDKRYSVTRDGDFVYFPVVKKIPGLEIANKKLEKRRIDYNLFDILKNEFTKKEIENLNRSFDVIGNIGIIEVDDELNKKAKIIAEALLKTNKNIKTVVKKVGEHSGVYRLQDYE
jgi:tRNA (guanine37-N1)-methyltransferase